MLDAPVVFFKKPVIASTIRENWEIGCEEPDWRGLLVGCATTIVDFSFKIQVVSVENINYWQQKQVVFSIMRQEAAHVVLEDD